jgi:hypothetical protein
MNTRQFFAYVLLLVCLTCMASGCAANTLIDQSSGPGDGVVKGTIPPDMSSYNYNPELALGAMFEKVLKANAVSNSCASTNADDFELRRIANVPPPSGCVATLSEPNHKAEERIVRGGANAKVNHLVGEFGLDAKYAFELLVTTPLAASYPASQQCVDEEKVKLMSTEPRTCEIYFVTGATLTQVTFRQYNEVTGSANYNALITVDGQLYGSTSYMQSYPILTVDFFSLGRFLERDEAGFLVPPTVAEAEAAVELIQNLTPEEFIIASALPEQDRSILPELSIENLLEDPAVRFDLPRDAPVIE